MELNGVANMKMILDMMVEDYPYLDERLVEVSRLYKQLDLLERYMIAVSDYENAGQVGEYPMWHEILQNPKAFPTVKEREIRRKKGA
jgi:hypothetical protein